MNTQDKQTLIKKAVSIIADNFGDSTAKLYGDFYQDKDPKDIKLSVKELLTELVGPKNAKKQLKNEKIL